MDQSDKIIFVKDFLEQGDLVLIKDIILGEERGFDASKYEEWTGGIVKSQSRALFFMLQKYKSKMEEITNLTLNPKYSFWRISPKGSRLPFHIDRPPCEISASINIGISDGKIWPFYVNDIHPQEIMMSPGDAVIYYGTETIHWRYPLESEWNIQWCIHYTDANGQFARVSPNDDWKDLPDELLSSEYDKMIHMKHKRCIILEENYEQRVKKNEIKPI